MASKAALELIIALKDEATRGLGNITDALKRVAGLAAVGGTIAGVGKAVWDAGQMMDEALDTIVTGTGASGEALAVLEQDFKAVFGAIPTEAGPAADVIVELNRRLGLTGDSLQELATPMLEMTRLLGGDAATNAQLFTRVMGDWGISTEDAAASLDMVFAASQATGVGVESLMAKIVQFGSPMRLMGFTFEDSVALMSRWEQQGVNTELVMGSLRIAAGNFAREGQPLRESLLATFDAIQNNTDASAALALGMEVFGARAGPDMVAAIREGRFSIDDLTAALKVSEGAIMETAAATADFPEKLQTLRNRAQVALAPVGLFFLDIANAVVDRVAPALDDAVALIQNLGSYLLLVVQDGDLFNGFLGNLPAQIQPVVQGIGEFILKAQAIGQQIMVFVSEHAEAFKAALIAIGALLVGASVAGAISSTAAAIAALANPITLIVAAVALLAAAWAEDWGGIRTQLTAWWNQTGKPIFDQLVLWLQTNIPVAIETLTAFWQTTLLPALQAVWAFIQESVLPILAQVVTWLGINVPVAVQATADFWNNTLWPALQVVWAFITGTLFPAFTELVTWLSATITTATQGLSDLWTGTLQPALNAVWTFVTGTLFPAFTELVTWLSTTIASATQAVSDLWTGTLQPALSAVWAFIQDSILPIFETLINVWIALMKVELSLLAAIWNSVVMPALRAVWAFIQGSIVPIFRDLIERFIADLKEALKELADLWDPTLKGALEKVLEVFIKIAGYIYNRLQDAMGVLSGVASAAAGAIDAIASAASGALGILNDLANRITSMPAFQGVAGAVGGAADWVGGAVSDVGGALGGLFRQHGGPVYAGHPYIVGEAGPELFVPRHAGHVVSNDRLGGPQTVINNYITVPEPIGSISDLRETLAALQMSAG